MAGGVFAHARETSPRFCEPLSDTHEMRVRVLRRPLTSDRPRRPPGCLSIRSGAKRDMLWAGCPRLLRSNADARAPAASVIRGDAPAGPIGNCNPTLRVCESKCAREERACLRDRCHRSNEDFPRGLRWGPTRGLSLSLPSRSTSLPDSLASRLRRESSLSSQSASLSPGRG